MANEQTGLCGGQKSMNHSSRKRIFEAEKQGRRQAAAAAASLFNYTLLPCRCK
jgi:hypothetical protein